MNSTNNNEEVEIIKPGSKKKIRNVDNITNIFSKDRKMLSPIIMGIVGLILLTNSDEVIILACYIIGGLILGFGIYNIISYSKLKKELHIENTTKMNIGILTITIGILIILLASLIKTFMNLLLGIWLLITGITKLLNVSKIYNDDRKTANFNLIEAIIVIFMGLYSIFFQNIFLTIIGIWMIIYAGIELYNVLKK